MTELDKPYVWFALSLLAFVVGVIWEININRRGNKHYEDMDERNFSGGLIIFGGFCLFLSSILVFS